MIPLDLMRFNPTCLT